MSGEGEWISTSEDEQSTHYQPSFDRKNGYDPKTGIYHSILQLSEHHKKMSSDYSQLNTAKFVLSQFPSPAQAMSQIALIDSATDQKLTYTQLHRSILSLATGLYRVLGIRKGDVIFVLSQNSIFYPIMCLAILSIGAILSPANPLNTESEIEKQVRLSHAKLAIVEPEQVHKLAPTCVPTLLTTRSDENSVSVQELIESCDPLELPEEGVVLSDTAAILYSSGTTGVSKGVVLTHANFIVIMKLLRYYVEVTSSQDDVFLCFVPMFHVYGLAFFGLGLFCSGVTTVLMQKFDFQGMLEAIQKHKINQIPAVPPVILGLVKYKGTYYDLSSLRRVTSGAAPLSKEVSLNYMIISFKLLEKIYFFYYLIILYLIITLDV